MAYDIDCGWSFPKRSTASVGAVRIVARNKWAVVEVVGIKKAMSKKVAIDTLEDA